MKVKNKIKNFIYSLWSTLCGICIIFAFWVVKLIDNMIEFGPWFFAWSIPVIILSFATSPICFYSYWVVWTIFIGLKAALQVQSEVLP